MTEGFLSPFLWIKVLSFATLDDHLELRLSNKFLKSRVDFFAKEAATELLIQTLSHSTRASIHLGQGGEFGCRVGTHHLHLLAFSSNMVRAEVEVDLRYAVPGNVLPPRLSTGNLADRVVVVPFVRGALRIGSLLLMGPRIPRNKMNAFDWNFPSFTTQLPKFTGGLATIVPPPRYPPRYRPRFTELDSRCPYIAAPEILDTTRIDRLGFGIASLPRVMTPASMDHRPAANKKLPQVTVTLPSGAKAVVTKTSRNTVRVKMLLNDDDLVSKLERDQEKVREKQQRAQQGALIPTGFRSGGVKAMDMEVSMARFAELVSIWQRSCRVGTSTS